MISMLVSNTKVPDPVSLDFAKSKDTGSGTFVLDTNMEIMGYPVYISELCSGVTFGSWSQMILCYWSGLDIMTDPFTNGSAEPLVKGSVMMSNPDQ